LLVQLPKPVRQFVAAFDGGQFPVVERQQSAAAAPSQLVALR